MPNQLKFKGAKMKSVYIVLDEDKIQREGRYDLDEFYAYLDYAAKEAKLTKKDKCNYLANGDKNDNARVAVFTLCLINKNKAITRNTKELFWLDDGVPYCDYIEEYRADKDIWDAYNPSDTYKNAPRAKRKNDTQSMLELISYSTRQEEQRQQDILKKLHKKITLYKKDKKTLDECEFDKLQDKIISLFFKLLKKKVAINDEDFKVALNIITKRNENSKQGLKW